MAFGTVNPSYRVICVGIKRDDIHVRIARVEFRWIGTALIGRIDPDEIVQILRVREIVEHVSPDVLEEIGILERATVKIETARGTTGLLLT